MTTSWQTDEEEHFSLLFKGILCSSSLVCHLVWQHCTVKSALLQVSATLFIQLLKKCSSSHSRPPSSDNVWIWKVVKSALLPLSATYLWQNFVSTLFWKGQKVKFALLHQSATQSWQNLVVTLFWKCQNVKMSFFISLPTSRYESHDCSASRVSQFIVTRSQDYVTTLWQTAEEVHFWSWENVTIWWQTVILKIALLQQCATELWRHLSQRLGRLHCLTTQIVNTRWQCQKVKTALLHQSATYSCQNCVVTLFGTCQKVKTALLSECCHNKDADWWIRAVFNFRHSLNRENDTWRTEHFTLRLLLPLRPCQ